MRLVPLLTAPQIIQRVSRNDEKLAVLDLTNHFAFQLKPLSNILSLCDALKSNTVVKILMLRSCDICDAGAEALGEALMQNRSVELLDLEQNRLTDAGIVALLDGLACNQSVRSLRLRNQKQSVVGEVSVQKAISVLETNLTLTRLSWDVLHGMYSRSSPMLSLLLGRNAKLQTLANGRASLEDTPHANLSATLRNDFNSRSAARFLYSPRGQGQASLENNESLGESARVRAVQDREDREDPKEFEKLKKLESVLKPVLESAREHMFEPSLQSHTIGFNGPQTCNVQEVSCSLAMVALLVSSIRIGGLVPDWIQYWPYHASSSEAASPEAEHAAPSPARRSETI
ncbi:unnamed protein product [Polarella glacialis]|uniref:Uncharacterized protein n=1 Tax=Polarella glacialis TaxID=89957 RepID=A0A813KNS4_POLGL|nr:unnamed protein product [Polarella glacialis]